MLKEAVRYIKKKKGTRFQMKGEKSGAVHSKERPPIVRRSGILSRALREQPRLRGLKEQGPAEDVGPISYLDTRTKTDILEEKNVEI